MSTASDGALRAGRLLFEDETMKNERQKRDVVDDGDCEIGDRQLMVAKLPACEDGRCVGDDGHEPRWRNARDLVVAQDPKAYERQ